MKHYIGVDKPEVEHTVDHTHWTQLPEPTSDYQVRNWYDSDNDPQSPLEADWEDLDD